MENLDYKDKYLKYKNKYLNLKLLMKGGVTIHPIDTSLKGDLYNSIKEYLKNYSRNIETLTMDTIHKLFIEINDKKLMGKIKQDKQELWDSILEYETDIQKLNKDIANLNFNYKKLENTPRPEDLSEDLTDDLPGEELPQEEINNLNVIEQQRNIDIDRWEDKFNGEKKRLTRSIERKKRAIGNKERKKTEVIAKYRKIEDRDMKMVKLQSLCSNVFDYAIRTAKVTPKYLTERFGYSLKDGYVYHFFEPLSIININNYDGNPYCILYTDINGYRAKSLINNNLVNLNKFDFTEVPFSNNIDTYKFSQKSIEKHERIKEMFLVETAPNFKQKFLPGDILAYYDKYIFFPKNDENNEFFFNFDSRILAVARQIPHLGNTYKMVPKNMKMEMNKLELINEEELNTILTRIRTLIIERY